jgi:PAS domain S-box-containing protein
MDDARKTKAQLIEELAALRQRVGEDAEKTRVDDKTSPSSSVTDYTRAFDAIPLPATLIDTDGIVVDVNQAFLDMAHHLETEVRREDRIGEHIASFAALEEERTRFKDFIDELLRTGKTRHLQWAGENELGQRHVWNVRASTLKDAGRQITGALVLWEDVTERKQAEKALIHSHDLMRYIIEHNRSAIAVHDRELKYVYVSQHYLDEYRVKDHDVIGKHHYDVFPDLPQKWRDVHQKALAGETSSAEDDPYVREDGTVDWTRWECRPWYESDGSIGGIIIYTEIITERKQAEEKLRGNERLLTAFQKIGQTTLSSLCVDQILERLARQILEAGIFRSLMVARVDERTKTVEVVENTFRGNPIIDEKKKAVGLRYNLDDDNITAEVARTGKMQVIEEWDERFDSRIDSPELRKGNISYFVPVKQGDRVLAVLATGSPIEEKSGILHRIEMMQPLLDQVVIALKHAQLYEDIQREITERKKAEEAIRESEERLRSVIETSPDHILLLDTDLNIQFANYASPGLTMEELIGTPIYLYVEEKNQAENKATLEGVLKTEEAVRYETAYNAPDGNVVYYETNAVVRRSPDSDAVIGLTLSARNITDHKKAEERLRESEAKYRISFNNSRDAINIFTPEGQIIEVNEELTRLSGYSEEELISMKLVDIYPESSGSDSRERIRQMQREETLPPFETILRKKEGNQIFVEIAVVSLRSYYGQGIVFQGNIRDITERKQSLESLRESEEKYRALVEEINDALYSVDSHGVITYASPVIESILGYTSSELVGHSIAEFFFPEDLPRMEEKTQAIFSGEKGLSEWRMKTKSGGFCWVRTSSHPILDENRVLGLRGVLTDITESKKSGQEIERLNETLEAAQKMAKVGYWRYDIASQVPTWSDQMFEVCGYRKEDGVPSYEEHKETWHPDDWEFFDRAVQGCTQGTPYNIVVRIRFPDDIYHHVNTQGFPVYDVKGEIKELFGTSQDITQYKRLEEELRERGERYDLGMRATKDGIYDWNLVTNEIYFSPGWKEMLGYEEDELQNDFSVWERLTDPQDIEESWKMLRDHLEGKIDRFELEFKMQHKEGHWVDILSRANAVFDPEGKPIRVVGTHVDITERKQMEEMLRESKERYRLLTENTRDVIFRTRISDGIYEYISPSSFEAFGFKPDEFYENPQLLLKMLLPGWDAYFHEKWVEINDGKRPEIYEFPIVHKITGETRWMHQRNVWIANENDELIALQGRVIDITESRQMERELIRLERLRAVGELSAGVSHNLNNILTNVLGPAQLLKRKTDDPELLREVNDIVTSAKRARDLVHELHLSVSTVKEDVLQPVSVNKVIGEAVQTSRPRWKDESEGQGIPIEVLIQGRDVPQIQGTEGGLHDILTNFIFNAVDAMPDGGTITIDTQHRGNQVQVVFSDTGTGMDEATKLRVFEPFFTTKMDIGTGLGLSTVYRTVTNWSGTIEVNSTLGEGTTFTLRFPVWMEEVAEKQRMAADASPTRSGKILVVDDDDAVCDLLARLLGEQHEVEAVTDGRQALAQFAPGKYDVVLIDLGMSGMSGDRLLREMRQIDPSVATVLITGWDLPDTDMRVIPFDFRVQKPFEDLDEVERVVARAMELHDERIGEKEGN